MVAATKKKKKSYDVEKVASQLAKVNLIPLAGDGIITIRARATFTTRSFDAGKYRVSVGLTHALLQLDHPSFEVDNAYQATLDKKTWSESWIKEKASKNKGGVKIGAKVKEFFGVLGISGAGQIERKSEESAEQKSNVPYRIVSATPTGWQIGTDLGDPRSPQGTVPEGLEHCLNGEYLSGRNEEDGDGTKDKTGEFALCVLKPKEGGNDPRITATLVGASGSLKVVVAPAVTTTPQSALQSHKEEKQEEEKLRKAIVEICVKRARIAQEDGLEIDAMLTGEFYLHHQEKHAPEINKDNTPQEDAPHGNECKPGQS